jgi:MYXO-CTERM domain-containing protein
VAAVGRILLGAAGIVMAVLLAAFVPLTIASHDLHQSADGTTAVLALALAGVGAVVARRQRRNPVGWVLLGSGLATMLGNDAELYLVLDYRIHHGTLPLGPAAAFWVDGLWALSFLIGTPALILFPDGDLPGRAWRWSMRAYLAASGIWLAGQILGAAAVVAGQQVHVDATGGVTNNPTGLAGTVSGLSWIFAIPIPLIWLSWVGRQIVSYRRSGEQRREQLKWLTGGAALLVVGLVISLLATDSDSPGAQAALIVSRLALVAFPVSMGVAILRYRLYEIDRILSRTVAYAVVTGLLVGAYVGLVTLATQAHPFSGAIGVAASTLAVAALFNPLRRRVQRLVDRRFNRARYDAEQTVAAFAARLKEAADLDSVRDDLAGVVHQTLEPAHVSLWVSPPGS